MTPRREPFYPLDAVQGAMERGDFMVTRTAMETASAIYCDTDDIRSCVLDLTAADFYKSMPSEPVYLKVCLGKRGGAVVISFKHDEDP